MLWVLLLLVIVIAIAGLLIGFRRKLSGGERGDYPYAQTPALFSPAERSFLGVLDQAVGEQYRIFGKVRVADAIQPRRGLDKRKRQIAFNEISSKHFDFLLCARSDLSILCAIELDDASHKQTSRRERDLFLENTCRAADLPLLRIPAEHGYTAQELRTRIYDALESVTFIGTKPQTQAITKKQTVAPPPIATKTDIASAKRNNRAASAPACPKCGSVMVRRRVKSGSRAGLVLWACSTFPKCRGALQASPHDRTEPPPTIN